MGALARLPADRPASAAAFAERLDEVRRAKGEAHPTLRSRPRLKWIVAAAGGVLAAVLIGTLLRSPSGSKALDASLLAVAPFDVLDSKLGLWREGMVDLLSRNLDGAGPLRTVSPTVVVRRWSGRADPESAAELGRATGAGLALYGSLLSSGRDSVRARATLYDVRRQSPVEEWELVDLADRVDRLGDSLTFRVLQGLGRTRPVGSVRLASLGSSSLPAVKAFLQGEQHLRRAEWDSALGYYERAIRLDSTFPLALRRASTALGWTRTGFDSLSTAFAFRAGAANRGLPPRDSLLVVSDSVLASLLQAGPMGARADTSWRPRLQRLFATLEEATTRYPDDPEAWHMLGDALDHFAPFAGRATDEMFRAFDRSIALDSAYAPSYIHPIEAAARDGPEAMRRYLRPYLALQPNDVGADGLRLVQRLLDSAGVSPSDLPTLFGQLPGPALFSAFNAVRRLPDTSETAVHIARFLASHPWSGPPANDSAVGRRRLAQSLLAHGRVRAGYDVLRENGALLFSDAAVFGVAPAETVAVEFRRRLSGPAGFLLAGAFPWWAGRRDTVSLRLASTHAESLARLPRSNDRATAPYVAASALAYLALARRDTSQAVQRFLALPEGGCPRCFLDRLTVAQLLAEQRKDGDAWRLLKAEYPTETVHPFATEVLWILLRGRVAERIGERERALRSYAWVAGMWRKADPELQPYVKEAREGLARLTAERK